MCPSGMHMPSGFVAIILFAQGLFDFKNVPMFLMMFTSLLSKIVMHPLLQNMRIERSDFFLGQGKCVRVVLRWGGCPEVVEQCVRKR